LGIDILAATETEVNRVDTKTALAVGEALLPKFSSLEKIAGKTLQAVWQVESLGCLEQVILDFGPVSLSVLAISDDDSVDFRCTTTTDLDMTGLVDASDDRYWSTFIGVPFGWGWITVNQQGYCDGMLLSFDGIAPQVVMNVRASSITLGRISMVAKQ
jgi:hypothetical protein